MVKILIVHKFGYSENELRAIEASFLCHGVTPDHVDIRDMANLPLADYHAIFLPPIYNAMFDSSKRIAGPIRHLHKTARPYAIHYLHTDIRYRFDKHIWDSKVETHKDKVDYFAESGNPVTLFTSYHEDILKDPKALETLSNRTFSKMGENSRILPVEWLTHFIWTEDIERYRQEVAKTQPAPMSIDKFYYGSDRKGTNKSLVAMGFGDSPNDRVFGPVGKVLRKPVEQLEGEWHDWIAYAKSADRLLFPYEPVKGDYQITLRTLEYALLGTDNVVHDPQVSQHIVDHLYDGSLDLWKESSERAYQQMIDSIKEN